MKVGPDITDKNKGVYGRTSPIYTGEMNNVQEEAVEKVTKKKTSKKKTSKKTEES